MKHVVLFSGGIASWATARRVAGEHGTADMVLLFTDTKTEDKDLYRFLDEAAADVGVPVTRIADGRDIWQVFRDERYLGNSRIDPCSKRLKREMSRKWLDANCEPDDTIVYLGFDWTEMHRHERAVERWKPWVVKSPMTEKPYRLRSELQADLEAVGIEIPRLYRMGFEHNNCGGGCVKAGQGHFAKLLQVFPARFAEWERNEQGIRDYLNADVSILRSGTLADLRERIEAGQSIPMFDIGGCACFDDGEDVA